MQMAFDHDLDRTLFINPTHQFSRQGLDNPDAIYFNAYLKEGVEYVVRGRRGTSADLSFQVMGGAYSATSAATLDAGLRRPRAGEGRRRQLRVHLRRRAGREDDDRARGLQRLGHRGARPDHHRADRHPRPAGQGARARPAGEALRGGRAQPGRLDPDLVRLPAVLPVQGAGQPADRRRSRRPAASRRSARRSGTTRWPRTRRWSSPCPSAPTAPTRASRSARTGTPRPTTRPTRPRSPRRRPSPTPTARCGS